VRPVTGQTIAWEISQANRSKTMKLNFDAVHYADTTEALRKAEVTSENKRSDWGRETLCGLFSGKMTEGDLTAALLAAFKPRKPNGKAGDTLSSLRYAKGGDAVRKAAALCLDIRTAATEGQIAEAFRPLAIAFATDAPEAPRTLYALRDEMQRLRKEAAKAAGNGEGEGADDAPEAANDPAPAPAVPLAVMAERFALALSEATDEDILAADDALTTVMEALRVAYSRGAAVEERQVA
jgi:hypothetical protein